MNCYACLVETGYADQSACAICKQCGAGVCRAHLVDIKLTSPAGSTSLVTTHRSRLLCQNCYRAAFPATSSSRPQRSMKKYSEKSGRWLWWERLWNRQPPTTLPSPEEAVSTVEQFLQHQSTAKKRDEPPS